MGHSSVVFSKKPGDVKRAKRSTKRADKLHQAVVDFADANYLGAEVMNIDPIEEETEIEETGIGIQTHLTMEELGVKFEQLSFA
ncbi:hypothetical protein NQ315_008950 [Exocentrus adspersus]|uniref:Uncharacterized protein n=1 Tax=Exocentrus adspersus TaxID=1586481 RepID=A0AAV8V9A2_9CUCU|nr:hypothetical protein NQ315_008950 [Exocentrus adspersus]